MGRTAGWIALHSGVAGGADVILIPEIPFDIDEVCRLIRRRHEERGCQQDRVEPGSRIREPGCPTHVRRIQASLRDPPTWAKKYRAHSSA